VVAVEVTTRLLAQTGKNRARNEIRNEIVLRLDELPGMYLRRTAAIATTSGGKEICACHHRD
jgi:hypothetical protein